MLNKIMKNASALLLSLTLLLPVQMLGTTAQETDTDPKDKIGEFLLNYMEHDSDYFDVTVTLIQPDYSDLYKQANDMFNEYPEWDGVGEDPVKERKDFFNQLKYKRWRAYINEFLNEVGLSEDRLAGFSPLIILMTKEEIYDAAANDKVEWLCNSVYPDVNYRYTTGIALQILRIAVGAEAADTETEDTEHYMRMSSISPVYDINQDGKITASDAYSALQSAVYHNGDKGVCPSEIIDRRIAWLLEKDASTVPQ